MAISFTVTSAISIGSVIIPDQRLRSERKAHQNKNRDQIDFHYDSHGCQFLIPVGQ